MPAKPSSCVSVMYVAIVKRMSFSGGGNEEHLRSWSLYGMVVFVCASRCAGLGGAESGRAGWRRVRMARARARRRGARLRAMMRTRRRGREKGLIQPTHQGVERALLGVGARERAAVGGEDHLAAGVVWGIVACGGRTGGGSPPEGRARRGQGCAASDAGSPLANLRRNKKNFIRHNNLLRHL